MDTILNWNAVALEANKMSHTNGKREQTGPPLSARALAIVHLAMHDAYAGVTPAPATWPTYLQPTTPGAPVPTPATLAATQQLAITGAAFTALNALFPSQKDYFAQQFLLLNGNKETAAHKYGEKVAKAILQDRRYDPNTASDNYIPQPVRNKHRADPDNPTQGYLGTIYGQDSKGFAVTERHTLAPPPDDNPLYQAVLKQVRYKGIKSDQASALPDSNTVEPVALTMTKRTTNETLIGLFWGYDGSINLGTPPRLYNQIIRKIAVAKQNTEAENVQLFALVNVAMADAAMLAWDQKYFYDFCRPVIGIRQYDHSCDPNTGTATNSISNLADTSWLPLGAPSTNSINPAFAQAPLIHVKNFSPNFPAYPSGHATFGAAAFQMVRLFYGPNGVVSKGGVNLPPTANAGNTTTADTLFDSLNDPGFPTAPIFFISDEFNGETQDNDGVVRPLHRRHFTNLWEMIKENGLSRVFLGVHWVTDAYNVTATDVTTPVFSNSPAQRIGGVPLGLTIAEDIFRNRNGKGIRKSTVGRRP